MTTSIRKGTALLDRKYPGWEKAIDLDRLDLASAQLCVLGQLFGGYGSGLAELWPEVFPNPFAPPAYEHGFNQHGGTQGYQDLTERWKRAIKRRLRGQA